MLQNYRHPQDPAITKNEDFTANARTILRIFCGEYATLSLHSNKKMMCSFMVAPLFTPNLLWGLL